MLLGVLNQAFTNSKYEYRGTTKAYCRCIEPPFVSAFLWVRKSRLPDPPSDGNGDQQCLPLQSSEDCSGDFGSGGSTGRFEV